MTTQFVQVFDKNQHVQTLLVQHKNPPNFQENWTQALHKVKSLSDEWFVTDVYLELEAVGWRITPLDSIDVRY